MSDIEFETAVARNEAQNAYNVKKIADLEAQLDATRLRLAKLEDMFHAQVDRAEKAEARERKRCVKIVREANRSWVKDSIVWDAMLDAIAAGAAEEDGELKAGDIIQITDPTHAWYPCLLTVDEVKSWGVLAAVVIPNSNDGSEKAGLAYNRLKTGVFEKVGTAVVLEAGAEGEAE